jgi:hypothetical protein
MIMLAAVTIGATACQDLVVANKNSPSARQAQKNIRDVQSATAGSMVAAGNSLFRVLQGNSSTLAGYSVQSFIYTSAQQTATLTGTGTQQQYKDILEPRPALPNQAVICSTVCDWGPRTFWADIGGVSSFPHDALRFINSQPEAFAADTATDIYRLEAFARFVRGWSWGYAALAFDSVHTFHESVDLDSITDPYSFSRDNLISWRVGLENAIADLDSVISITANPAWAANRAWIAGSNTWFLTNAPITQARLAEMAYTLKARLKILGARTPDERAALPWDTILGWTEKGVKAGNDYAVQLSETPAVTSQVLIRMQNNSTTATTNGRWNYHTIGMADQPFAVRVTGTGSNVTATLDSVARSGYQNWLATPVRNRSRFDIVTPDRRITGQYSNGVPNPQANGSYTCYREDNNGFDLGRGRELFSAYQWSRHKLRNSIGCAQLAVTGNNAGLQPLITAVENNLMRAEALVRLNRDEEALPFINATRTAAGLVPVTTAGVQQDSLGMCVPRMDNGQCGTLYTAIRYERMIELAGQDVFQAYADSRGWGMLADGSLTSFPVPGNVLDMYGLPNYTNGGRTGRNTATYAPFDGN